MNEQLKGKEKKQFFGWVCSKVVIALVPRASAPAEGGTGQAPTSGIVFHSCNASATLSRTGFTCQASSSPQ
jgi:hypothetical protein